MYYFPSLVNKNAKLKSLYDYMTTNNISIANFESAVKAGLNGTIALDDIVSGKTAKVQLNEMLHRGIQMATPEHHIDSTGKHGSQIRALVIADLDANTTYTIDGKPYKSDELVEHYQELIIA